MLNGGSWSVSYDIASRYFLVEPTKAVRKGLRRNNRGGHIEQPGLCRKGVGDARSIV